ncbi:MAG: PAS domain S-box protein [Fulvivirga sp.]
MDLQLDPIECKRVSEITRKSFDEKKEYSYESTVSLNGITVVYRATIIPIIKDEEAIGAMMISLDISHEKEVESKLIESERMYRQVVENANSIILRINKDANIVFANNYALNFFQLKENELIGQNVVGTIVPEFDSDGNDLTEMVKEAFSNPSTFGSRENENVKKDGTKVWVSWGNYPQFNELGEFEEMLSIGNDITALKVNEKKLLQQNQLLEQAQQCIINVDMQGKINYMNQSAVHFYEYQKSELLGQHISVLYPEDKHDSMQNDIIDPLIKLGKNNVETVTINKNGVRIPTELHLALIRNTNGQPIGMTGYCIDITEKTKKEKHRNSLAQIVESANVIIGIADLEGFVIYVNSAGVESLNIDMSKKFKFIEHIAPEEQDKVEEIVLPTVMEKGRWSGESKFIKGNGEKIDVLFDIFLLRNDDGEPEALATVSKDITESKKQQAELIKNEKRLIEAQEIGKTGNWEYDYEKDNLYWSDQVFNTLSLEKSNVQPSNELLATYVHEKDKDNFKKQFLNHIKNQEPLDFIHRIVTEENKILYIRQRGKSIYDDNGKAIKSYGTASDVTDQEILKTLLENEQERLEELVTARTSELNDTIKRLNESEENYRSVIESTNLGISIALKDNVIFVNSALLEMFGYSDLEEFNTKSMFDHVTKEYRPFLHDRYKKVQEGKLVKDTFTIDCLKKNGEIITCQLSVKNIKYDGFIGRQASFVDITELKKQEEKLRKNEEEYRKLALELDKKVKEKELKEIELQRARDKANEALNVKNEFLSIMSHEIRTPLNGIISLSELLTKKIKNTDELAIVNTLNQSADHLMNLLTDILDYSKIQANKVDIIYTSINVRELIPETILLYKKQSLDKKISLNYNIDKNVPSLIETDKTRLKQILNNLINNAIKFTDAGSINVTLELESITTDKQTLVLSVSDTGCGIDKADQDKIFDAFSQSKMSSSGETGTGLGLSIVKSLVALLGGELHLESRLNEGSTFVVLLPLRKSKEHIALKGNSKEGLISEKFNDQHVLYVEDVLTNQFVMQNVLEDLGISCAIAGNEIEALNLLNSRRFDLIIMDIQLPGKDGFEITKEIRKGNSFYSNIPIIGFTADTSKKNKKLMMHSGMDDLLTKPLVTKQLINILNSYLRPIPYLFSFSFYENTFKNSPKKLADFYEVFKSDMYNFLEVLEDYNSNDDLDLINKEAHKIRSIIGQLQFSEFEELLDETFTSNNSSIQLADNICRIKRKVIIIIEAINTKL